MTFKETKAIAVRYHAYHSARDKGDDLGVAVWGTSLIDALSLVKRQDLINLDLVRRSVKRARERMTEAA